MKRLLSVLLLMCASVVAQGNSAPDAPPTPDAAPAQNAAPPSIAAPQESTAQKARQLLDQMIGALGGPAWLNYKTLEQQGRSYSFFHGNPNSAGTLFWRFFEYPDKERRELTKQRDVIYIYNGDKGYERTYKGTTTETDKNLQEYLRRRNYSLEVVVREWLKDPETVLFYEGQRVADQQLVDVVTIVNKNNDQVSIGIDVHTHLPIDKRFTWRDPDKYKVEDETTYGNYRNIQGIETPYTITYKRDGEIIGQSFLTHAEYNAPFAPGFFDAQITYKSWTDRPEAEKP
jgi:hypothetical protein